MPKVSSKSPKMIEAVLRYYEAGVPVTPSNGKGPVSKDWPNKKFNQDELRKSFENSRLNVSLVLNQSKWVDIECDSDEAEANLQELFGGKVPKTPTWQSKRGKHRLFLRPDGLPKRKTIEIDGIEFHIGNGKGASAVLPPSEVDDFRRRWLPGLSLDDIDPAELPATVIDRLCKTKATTTAPIAEGEIPKGKRNDTLFSKACSLKQAELDEGTIVTALLDLNSRLCKPPLPEDEVRKIAQSAASQSSKTGDFVSGLLLDVELWHCENDEPFATVQQGEHLENWSIGKRSRPWKRWISKSHYDATKTVLSAGELSDICAMLEGKAVFDSPRFQLQRRTAQHKGKFYIDLCDEEWRAIEIDGDGWRIVSNLPVKFRRAKAMQALPVPILTSGTELKELLRPFLNIRDTQWPHVAGWLVAALRSVGPFPILKLLGEQGSAKTTTARVLRSLVDPNSAPVRAEPRSTRDLTIAANNAWILCLDNLSVIKPDLSDAFCRLSTGGGFATRTLYTDDEESIFDAQRPIILTSIEEIGTRSDLLERSLIIELPSIQKKNRRAEKPFWRDFEKVRPQILGALLDIVSSGIRNLPKVERRYES